MKTLDLNNDIVCTTEETISDEAFGSIRGELLPVGTVMVAMYGGQGTIGKAGKLGIRAATNQAICSLLPNPSIFDSDFLLFLLLHIRPQWMQFSSGNRKDPNINKRVVSQMLIPLPPLDEQHRIARVLRDSTASMTKARLDFIAQEEALVALIESLLRTSLSNSVECRISDCLKEITAGVGQYWSKHPVLGATRSGLAPAKEGVGKYPERYKPVRRGTIFYNPMRILLGSIAMIDDSDPEGITSPDYVAMNCVEGKLHPRWFYYWFRSKHGAEFIKSMSRGAVRERLLFKRLAPAKIKVPDWKAQLKFAEQVAEIRKLQKNLQSRLEALELMQPALLREAFKGKI